MDCSPPGFSCPSLSDFLRISLIDGKGNFQRWETEPERDTEPAIDRRDKTDRQKKRELFMQTEVCWSFSVRVN